MTWQNHRVTSSTTLGRGYCMILVGCNRSGSELGSDPWLINVKGNVLFLCQACQPVWSRLHDIIS